jgi:hypothetical protein
MLTCTIYADLGSLPQKFYQKGSLLTHWTESIHLTLFLMPISLHLLVFRNKFFPAMDVNDYDM